MASRYWRNSAILPTLVGRILEGDILMAKEKTSKRVKAHQRYKLSDGTLVPGVTTITGLLHKPALVPWANNLGLQGINVRSYVDEKARAGTLAHEMILAHFKGEKANTSDYTSVEIDLAENAFLSFLEWEKNKKIEPIYIEHSLVSERHGYGGTFDLLATMDSEICLMDFKTGSGIYREYWLQLAGYMQLLFENYLDLEIEKAMIINIPRTEDENFIEDRRSDRWIMLRAWPGFKGLLDVYKALKKMEK